jgi:MFS transporter, MHS family, proline/betaine transporter
MLMQGAGATVVLACKVAFVFLTSLMVGGSTVYLAEAFPPHLRTSGMAISLNITAVLFGGTLPLVSVWLTSTSGSSLAPAWYLVVAASLTAVFASRLSGLDSKPAVLRVPVVDG